MKFYASFGTAHRHEIDGQVFDFNHMMGVEAPTITEARRKVLDVVGIAFSTVYTEAQALVICDENNGLRLVDLKDDRPELEKRSISGYQRALPIVNQIDKDLVIEESSLRVIEHQKSIKRCSGMEELRYLRMIRQHCDLLIDIMTDESL